MSHLFAQSIPKEASADPSVRMNRQIADVGKSAKKKVININTLVCMVYVRMQTYWTQQEDMSKMLSYPSVVS